MKAKSTPSVFVMIIGVLITISAILTFTTTDAFPGNSDSPASSSGSDGPAFPNVAHGFDTNGLWLEVTNATPEGIFLNLRNATDYVYEIWSKTNLLQPDWDIAYEVFPTDTNCMPFALSPASGSSPLFIWARDWTGITSGGNQVPEWWFWKYFHTLGGLSDTNLDSRKHTLLFDFNANLDPHHSLLTSPQICLGQENLLLLTAQGDVLSCGDNYYGELGDFTHLDSTNLIHVVGMTNIVQIASGYNHCLALDANGIVWAWGNNDSGQLGDGTYDNSNLPTPVIGITNNVVAIAAGGAGALALDKNGSVWEWGALLVWSENYHNSCLPIRIDGLPTNAVAVAMGRSANVLLTDGSIWSWCPEIGKDSYGPPFQITPPVNIAAIYSGYWNIGIDPAGYFWEIFFASAQALDAATNFTLITSGSDSHYLAIDHQGQLWSWGQGADGQLGTGAYSNSPNPHPVSSISNIVSIAAEWRKSAAVNYNGCLWQWGNGVSIPALTMGYVNSYQGTVPHLNILDGNHQISRNGFEFDRPLSIRVTDRTGLPIPNAPLSIEVVSGDATLRTVSVGSDNDGLRLTADPDGCLKVFVYARTDAIVTNCVIRIIAANDGQVVVTNLSGTIEYAVPPLVNFTHPIDHDEVLVHPNQPLTITVAAKGEPAFPIQRVDYDLQSDGGSPIALGEATTAPFTLIWTNADWWNDAFVGQYTVSATAWDCGGAESEPASVAFTVALDSDGCGLPDYWQLKFFGHLGIAANQDADGDGLDNLAEYRIGTGPLDYYNGIPPVLEIVAGNDQFGDYGAFLSQPVVIQVNGPLTNAPLTISVTNGTALLAKERGGSVTNVLHLKTDTHGLASVWIYFPPEDNRFPDSTINVTANTATQSISTIVYEFVPLAHWTFNDTNTWAAASGQKPLSATNVFGVPSWSSNAIGVDNGTASIIYRTVEPLGHTNIECGSGSVLFWFKPNWTSAALGGEGPTCWGRFIEIGTYNADATDSWWSLYLTPDGNSILFGYTSTGVCITNLSAPFNWYSNQWYQVALTYAPTGTALFLNGKFLTNGPGIIQPPPFDSLTSAFSIGSGKDGKNCAYGTFDELATFKYALPATNTTTFNSELPDWWLIKYYRQIAYPPDFQPDNDGWTLLLDYRCGRIPNVPKAYLQVTNQYVRSPIVPLTISVLGGDPAYMSIIVTTNKIQVPRGDVFDLTSNFWSSIVWHPFSSNVTLNLNSGDAKYYVWLCIKGIFPDGFQTWANTTIVMDTSPPTLSIDNANSNIGSFPITQLRGQANEEIGFLAYDLSNSAGIFLGCRGYVNAITYSTNTPVPTSEFQCYNIPLEDGTNLLTVRIADLAGNVSSTNLVVYRGDVTNNDPPALTILWPPDNTHICGTNFTVQALVNDPTISISAEFKGPNIETTTVPGVVGQNGIAWVKNLPLRFATNLFLVTVSDSAGNCFATNLTFFRSPATVTINPLPKNELNKASVSIAGTISEPAMSVLINGVTANVDENGNWSANDVPVNPGGVAQFDVVVRSGDSESIGLEHFAFPQPPRVTLMSYDGQFGYQTKIVGSLWHPLIGTGDATWWNAGDTISWSWSAGGNDRGFEDNSGGRTDFSIDWGSYMYDWNTILTNGDCGFQPDYRSMSNFRIGRWQNVSITTSAAGSQLFGAWQAGATETECRTKIMIEATGQAGAGPTVNYIVRTRAWNPVLGTAIPIEQIQIAQNDLAPVIKIDGSVWGQAIISAPAGVNVDITPSASGNYAFEAEAIPLDQVLAVDANRDGTITFEGSDDTSSINPFRFWINDAKEQGDVSSADNDIPGSSTPNYALNNVNGRSDLINFFPIALNLNDLLQRLPLTNGYEFHLSQADSAVKFVYTGLSQANAFDYLTDVTNTTGYGVNSNKVAWAADTIAVPSQGVALDTNWLKMVQGNGGIGIILMEGAATTHQPLNLEIWHRNQSSIVQKLGGVPLYLSIDSVEDMYRWINLRDSFTVSGETQPTINYPSRTGQPANFPDGASDGRLVIYVHGFNVSENRSRAEFSQAFKRLWQSRSKAMFTGVSWYGDQAYSQPLGTSLDYYSNVRNAFLTAPALASAVAGLPGAHKFVIAHSLGNMVVSSAIVDSGMSVEKYFAIDAAVAMEAYDGSIKDLGMVNPNVGAGVTFQGWPNYDTRLWSTEWYQLFGSSDARSVLTWRGRFNAIPNLYNFYSTGEEVLENPPGYQQLPSLGKEWIWVTQEMRKGTGLFDLLGTLWLVDSHPEAGWALNTDWYVLPSGAPPGGNKEARYPWQATTNDISDDALRADPFCRPFNDSNLTEAGGSAEAANIQVRAEMLGVGMPALSHAAGANSVSVFVDGDGDRNLPLMGFETGWPAERVSGQYGTRWLHSDLKDVAYPFNHELHDTLVQLGGLNQ